MQPRARSPLRSPTQPNLLSPRGTCKSTPKTSPRDDTYQQAEKAKQRLSKLEGKFKASGECTYFVRLLHLFEKLGGPFDPNVSAYRPMFHTNAVQNDRSTN
jgi:hypothetical protein